MAFLRGTLTLATDGRQDERLDEIEPPAHSLAKGKRADENDVAESIRRTFEAGD
jgi:hypothetical protein